MTPGAGPGGTARGPRRSLDTQVMYLQGVGPARADALRRLGIFTVRDLIHHIPHRYEDASTIARISHLRVGDAATIVGRVISKGIIPTRKGLRVFQAVVKDPSGMIECGWPGQPFLDRSIKVGDVLLMAGAVRFFHGRQFAPRETINMGADEKDEAAGRVLAVYPATEGFSFKQIRALVDRHLDAYLPLVTEYLPAHTATASTGKNTVCVLGNISESFSIREWGGMTMYRDELTSASSARIKFGAWYFANSVVTRAKALVQLQVTNA